MDYSTFWWLMVSAVVMGMVVVRLLDALWDLAIVAMTACSNAGERLWRHSPGDSQ